MFVSCLFFIVSASISCHSQARIDQNRAEALRRKRAKEAWGSGEFVLLAMSLFHSCYTIFLLFCSCANKQDQGLNSPLKLRRVLDFELSGGKDALDSLSCPRFVYFCLC